MGYKKYIHHSYEFISVGGKHVAGVFVAFHAYDLDDHELLMEKLRQETGCIVDELLQYAVYA